MLREIRWHGRGGQGAKTVSEILALAAMETGFFVQAFPEYGPERSGAPVLAFNRIADKPILIHSSVYEPNGVVVLDDSLLFSGEVNVVEGLQPGGFLLVDSTESAEQVASAIRHDGVTYRIDGRAAAQRAGSKFANVPVLGALARVLGLEIALDVVKHAVTKTFSRKLSPDKLEANIRALQEGYESVERVATAAAGNGRAEALVTLPGYAELAPGGVVVNAGSTRLLKTGGWRGGLKPAMNSSLCVNCLLCWVNCPDGAIVLRDTQMTGFDYNHCKGCGICANACPTTAIKMIGEEEKTPEFGRFERSETW